MKKLFLLGFLISLMFTSRAQSPWGIAGTFPLVAGDTLVNTDTVFKTISVTAGYRELGFQALINKIGGTAPSGKMILWASMDGKNYVAIDSATYAITSPSTLVTPTFTHSALIAKTGAPYTNYAVLVTNSATTTAQVRIKYVLRYTSTARGQ